MDMHIESVHLDDVLVLRPDVFEDERGFFLEAYRRDQFGDLGLPGEFVQDNHSGKEAVAFARRLTKNRRQLYAPAGFARGFCVLSDFAEIQYKCTGTYNSKGESGILWNDPAVAIDWPVTDPILSDKDRKAQTLAGWPERPEAEHFRYDGPEYQGTAGG